MLKPEFILIDYTRGALVGIGTEDECHSQLKKCLAGERSMNSYIIAEVKVLSKMERIES